MQSRPVKRVGIVLMTPDRGLAGALSGNVNRRAGVLADRTAPRDRQSPSCRSRSSRSGARDATSSCARGRHLIAEFTRLGDQPSQVDVRAIAQAVTDAYLTGEVDRVHAGLSEVRLDGRRRRRP